MDAGPIEALAAAQTLISMPEAPRAIGLTPVADIQANLLPIAYELRIATQPPVSPLVE
jgi:hypothetical protein